MRIAAAVLAGGAFVLLTATSFGQTLPYAGASAIDQPASEPSLLPTAGLTLEPPRDNDPVDAGADSPQRPSDGLGLQFYGRGLSSPPGENDREGGNPNATPPFFVR